MISPGNSHTSRGFFLRFRFCLGHVLCNSEISLSIMASMRFLICSLASSSWPSVHDSLESSTHLPCKLMLSFCLLFHLYPSYLWRFSDLSCSFCQKEAQVCRSLRHFGLTAHVSISWGWLIIQPLVLSSLIDFSPWDMKEVVILIKGNLGLFVIMNPLL